MNNKNIVWLMLVLQLLVYKANAQQIENGAEMLEVQRVAEVYHSVPNLSFNLQYTYADSSQPSTILEQLTGSAKISYGKYWCMLDSIEYLQGYQYRVAVYQQDSSIVISDGHEYNPIIQLPPTDSLFIVNNVSSMNITSYDDSTNVLTVQFRSDAPYSQCLLYYDAYKYLIRKIQYRLKGVPSDPAAGMTSGVALITLSLSNYSEQAIDPAIFQEDQFIYKMNGQFYTKPAYANYRLSVLSTN